MLKVYGVYMTRTKRNTSRLNMKGNEVDLYVGQRLRKRRGDMGFTQKGLASYLNVTFQQIQKYEKGCNRISCSKLYEIAQILKTQIGYFFEGMEHAAASNQNFGELGEGEQAAYSASEANYAEHEMKILMKNYRKIKSPEMRKLALEVVKKMSSQ